MRGLLPLLDGYTQGAEFGAITFPEPQYLGAKHSIIPWIFRYLPDSLHSVLDGFGGSGSFAFAAKKLGLKVHMNDFMGFAHMIGLSLIENKDQCLTPEDTHRLFLHNPTKTTQIHDLFCGVFFDEDTSHLLDHFRANVEGLDNPYKRALALTIMNRSLTRKIIMGHFAHLQAIPYANDPARVRRNPSIARPIQDLFFELLPSYNQAVFDNHQNNISHHQDILTLLPTLRGIDLAYYDPPYAGSHSDYQAFYHMLETFVMRWDTKAFRGGTKRYHPPRDSGFDKKSNILKSLHQLFALSEDIKCVMMSYNCRSFPDIQGLLDIIRHYRTVTVKEKEYKTSRGGKGSVSGSREYLLICT